MNININCWIQVIFFTTLTLASYCYADTPDYDSNKSLVLDSDQWPTKKRLYTKLDDKGRELSDESKNWRCVKDNRTGLVWEVHLNDQSNKVSTYKWSETKNHINSVNKKNLCGASNWRLPSKAELLSIVEQNKEAPKIDTNYFPNTQNGFYWSSSEYEHHDNAAWLIYFTMGSQYPGNKQIIYYTRAVRSNT